MSAVVVAATPEQTSSVVAGSPGAAVSIRLKPGALYALRVSVPVYYRAGSGDPNVGDVVIGPTDPLHLFRANVGELRLAAVSAAGIVSLFPAEVVS